MEGAFDPVYDIDGQQSKCQGSEALGMYNAKIFS